MTETKALVHPKNEHFVYLYISLFRWAQKKIFWRKFVTRQIIDFHGRNQNAMEVNSALEKLSFTLI